MKARRFLAVFSRDLTTDLRRPLFWFWIALLVLVLLSVPLVVAAAPDDGEIARLVKQLGDDDFDKREAASKRLTETGEPALFDAWTERWSDLVSFEIFPVISSAEAAAQARDV